MPWWIRRGGVVISVDLFFKTFENVFLQCFAVSLNSIYYNKTMCSVESQK
jgi:hypothetical protein